MTTQEQDIRVDILNTLLTTPHRELDKVWPVHQQMIGADPRFYVKLAAWYANHGDVRDHKEMFIINLVLSDFTGHREVGLAMLRELPPYQVLRIVDFIGGRKTTRKIRPNAKLKGKHAKSTRQKAAQALVAGRTAEKAEKQPTTVTEEFGLFRNIPRAMKTEVSRYLRERENDPQWFDGSVLSARKAMKRLYALLHIRPDDRAQKILFEKNPPEGSRLHALRLLAAAENPVDQARAIVELKIPYRIAATVIHQMTPTVLVALIEQMSPQELINNLAALKRRGALDVPEIQAMVTAKLETAKTASRVSALKTDKAITAAGISGDLKKSLEDVSDTQIKAKGRISRPTALLVDKSSSMHLAIELGKRIGAMISTICESDLYTYAFDTMAHEITSKGENLADWERAFEGIMAHGATSCGVALTYMTHKKQYVEQVIVVTDEMHNTRPSFVAALRQYNEALNADPTVVIVRTPNGTSELESECRRGNVMVDVFKFEGDYYSLPNLIPMLSRPNKVELLMEIMDYPLPERKAT